MNEDVEVTPEQSEPLAPTPAPVEVPDYTVLEEKLDTIVETMEQDRLDQQEKEKLLAAEEQKNEEQLQEEQKVLEQNEQTVLALQETQTDSLALILEEMKTSNELTVTQNELLEKQNDLIIETGLTLLLTIVIVTSIKVFIDQILKW